MPSLLSSGAWGSMQSIYKLNSYAVSPDTIPSSNPRQANVYVVDSGPAEQSAPITKQNVGFLSTMADKLQELSQAIEAKIEYIIKTAVPKPKNLDNFILAKVDTPNMDFSVGAEYIIYVQKFGPPPLGKFDPEKLAEIRAEYSIGQEQPTDTQPTEPQPTDTQPTEPQPTDTQPTT